MDPKALENVGQRCSSVQPQIRRVAHHHLKVQGTAGHCFITLTGQRNLAMRGSSKQDSTEPQLEPADEANCELQHQRRQKFSPFPNPAKANRFNACNGLGAQTHRFSKESKAVRGQVLLWNNLQHN